MHTGLLVSRDQQESQGVTTLVGQSALIIQGKERCCYHTGNLKEYVWYHMIFWGACYDSKEIDRREKQMIARDSVYLWKTLGVMHR